jgi:hypothetical protein
MCINYVFSEKAEEYYLTIDGKEDSLECTTYEKACKTIDYVMIKIINSSISNKKIYVDSGIYNCTISTIGPNYSSYSNKIFSLIGYISSSVVVDDISTYPTIVSNRSDKNDWYVFYFTSNVIACFEYIKFFIGNNSSSNRRMIGSFVLFILFY